MNYRHLYHAGNFADVIKHIILICTLEHLKSKDKGFSVIDAFSGSGLYSLNSTESIKTDEKRLGISNIIDKNFENPYISKYLDIVRTFYTMKQNFYPGSPFIIAKTIREQDDLILSEKNSEEFEILQDNLKRFDFVSKNIQVHLNDGYSIMKAYTPMKSGRGLIFVDPPFEIRDETKKITDTLSKIYKRITANPFMVWFPIKNDRMIGNFYSRYKNIGFKENILLEFTLDPCISKGLNKCGILISNPPNIRDSIQQILTELRKKCYTGDMNLQFNIKEL